MRKVYISGPITGLPGLNFPAFESAENKLRSNGYAPLNPARNPPGLDYRDYMDISMAMVIAADWLFVLDGHDESKGATAEIKYAESIGIPVIYEVGRHDTSARDLIR